MTGHADAAAPLLRRTMARWLRHTTFRRQLTVAVACGVLLLALCSSLVSSWQASLQIRANLVSQGKSIAESLATRSTLALLYGSGDNAVEAVASTLAFPDVIGVEIRDAAGRLLLARGDTGTAAPRDASVAASPYEAQVEAETDTTWHFVAPVRTRNEASPFEVAERKQDLLGRVHVVQSKATLRRMQANVFFANLAVSLSFALAFLFAIRLLAARLTRPLAELSDAMQRAERGEADVRAKVDGPKDIGAMAYTFNRMIGVLQQHRDHLEDLVAERTAELRVAKERAEVASQAKSTFLSSMSHELRTPLNAVLGYAQILQMHQGLDAKQAMGLATIQAGGEHLLMLITDILDLSSIEAGKTELHVGPMNPGSFLHGIGDIIRVKADEKGLLFTAEVSPGVPRAVEADERRLRQVLLNLMGNAVKFTDHGEVSLSLLCLASDATQATLRFEVRDTGVGITPDQTERIFAPFEQVGDRKRRAGGSGLGLAISRQLVRLMGGDIRVDSVPDAGSRFWFELTLPVLETPVGVLPAAGAVVGYRGARRSVLVVDDTPASRAMLADLLSLLGFDVREAAQGEEALARMRLALPDLVVMDMVMPVMSGLEAMRHIRNHPDWARVPIIAVSANASNTDRTLCMTAGASAFLSKPISRTGLLDMVGKLLAIDWIDAQPPEPAGAALVVPPAVELERLQRLAVAGNMRDIREHAKHLAGLDPQYVPFANKLAQMALASDSQAILAWVRQCAAASAAA